MTTATAIEFRYHTEETAPPDSLPSIAKSLQVFGFLPKLHAVMAEHLRAALREQLQQLETLPIEELLEQRYQRLMAYGVFRETPLAAPALSSWSSSVVALLSKDREP